MTPAFLAVQDHKRLLVIPDDGDHDGNDGINGDTDGDDGDTDCNADGGGDIEFITIMHSPGINLDEVK